MQNDNPQFTLRNISYTIYDRDTGAILIWGTAGSPKSVNNKLQAGQGLILGEQISGEYYTIDVTTEQPIRKPEPPKAEATEEQQDG